GVEPGPEVRAAHLRVLQAQQSLARVVAQVPTVAAQLPAAVADFTGRAGQVAQLDAILAQGTGNGAAAVVVSAIGGTAGVGKTALAVYWAHRVRDRFPDGQLYLNLRGHAGTPPLRPVDALTRFLPALGVPSQRVPSDVEDA